MGTVFGAVSRSPQAGSLGSPPIAAALHGRWREGSGLRRRRGDLLRRRRQLHDPDVIAERVTQSAVDPVELLGRLLSELDAPGEQRLVGLAAIVRGEADRKAGRTLRHQVANLFR